MIQALYANMNNKKKFKKKSQKRAGGVAQVLKSLANKHKALCSSPSTQEKIF
jgi:hypothetical protein